MNAAQPLLSSSLRKRNKRSYDGSANTRVCDLLDGFCKHKVDKRRDASDSLRNTERQNGANRMVIRSSHLKEDWLGLWRGPLQNPFNMYGTLPSKTRSRDKRKAFSVPPLDDFALDMSKRNADVCDIMGAKNLSELSDNVSTHCMDMVERQLRVPRSLEMQRISTILSDPKSTRSSITASTARSTIDSFRFSDSFDECILGTSPREYSKHIEVLMSNLYLMTRNGFLSGSLPEVPWSTKGQVDADFIAISLARRHGSNPCLQLFKELEAVVSMPSRHRTYKDCDVSTGSRPTQSGKYAPNKYTDTIGGPLDAQDGHTPMLGGLLQPRVKSHVVRSSGFQMKSEEDMLLWNASTECARDTIRRAGIVRRPVKYDLNDDFMVTDADDYAVLSTRFGRIIYSPKFQDDVYMYRFVILTKEAQEAVETLSRTPPKQGRSYANPVTGKRCLSEFEIVRQLGIQMSPGWEHFMYFKNAQKELVLRKRL
ncbi:hypothetical protein X943_004071 [Babesia divergens]|uniref:Cyclin-dependent kinases regulatory subunit n=1 Tax=Babesia divergens TaxID=32595 RepID=A0AAD9GK26_BABDI|nr:hypothetical protein X943_004071 [Babesia divergens]